MYVNSFENTLAHTPTEGRLFPHHIISNLVISIDSLAIFFSGLIIYVLQQGWSSEHCLAYLSAFVISTFLTVISFYFAKLYDLKVIINSTPQISKILLIWALVLLVLIVFANALEISNRFPQMFIVWWFPLVALLLCLERTGCYLLFCKLAKSGRLSRKIIFVGGGEQAEKLIKHLDKVQEPWNQIIGIFDDRLKRIGPNVMGYPVLGTVDNLLSFARKHHIDDVIVTIPWNADQRLFSIITKLKELPVHVHLGSDLVGFMYPSLGYSHIGNIPMLDIAYKPLVGWNILLKELEDKMLAILLLILVAPLMLIITVAIKLDSKGPVLFRQPRHGFNNKIFSLFKFRTMHDIPETRMRQAQQNDARVTRVGRFLRRTSLDELPQLLNVLQGTMSLIGPRPHPIELNEEFAALIGGYFSRHRVKPGITGWAQINGLRGETDTHEKMKARVEYDIYYIENWSFLFDLKILVKTLFVGFIHKNAY